MPRPIFLGADSGRQHTWWIKLCTIPHPVLSHTPHSSLLLPGVTSQIAPQTLGKAGK